MKKYLLVPAAILAGSLLSVGCSSSESQKDAMASKPGMEWKSELTSEMKAVLDAHAALNPKPIETLSPEEARKQPSVADAVKSLMTKKGMDTSPMPVGGVSEQMIPGTAGEIPVRIYTPKGDGPFPVVVYIHGGGWVIATNDTYDSSARALCNESKAVIVAVEYRKAPEHKFPAAHEDVFAAYKWVLANASSIKGDPKHVDVAGESAGGNMTIAVGLLARDRNVQAPKHLVAVYPVAQLGEDTPSNKKYADAKPLNKPMLAWFGKHTMSSPADAQNPLLAPLKADLKGLPPTTIITAQIDPLMSEGKLLAEKLEEARVPTRYRNFDGVTHEFFGMGAVVPEAKAAVKFAAEGLK